jgi:hypothetical protein
MDDPHTYRVRASPCPGCGLIQDAATNVGSQTGAPLPGDATVCLGCGLILVYAEDLGLIRPTDPELFELMLSECGPSLERAQRAVLNLIEDRRSRRPPIRKPRKAR